MKELVENSLDSGATCIQINLIHHGRDCIKVTDDGSGIEESDFASLGIRYSIECYYNGLHFYYELFSGLKYHTSKLANFSDLLELETFGFRGEALSSLCALSDLSIITRHCSSEYGFELKYNKDGILIEKEKCARSVGTTVIVNNIFKNLPVRALEFATNIKKEFKKMTKILYDYCLVSVGVKIVCTNAEENKTKTIFSTNRARNVLDNILSVFGSKVCKDLVEIKPLNPEKEILDEYNLPAEIPINVTWECFVSSCCHKLGRSAPDRQFFYINGRPCDLPKISKLINYIYHQYNNKQYPFVFLNIKLDKSSIDVNVTPDKRTIFFTEEQLIFAMIKSNFERIWKDMQGVYTIKNIEKINDNDNKRKFLDSVEDAPISKKPFISRFSNADNLQSNKDTLKMKFNKYKFKNLKLSCEKEEKNVKTVTSNSISEVETIDDNFDNKNHTDKNLEKKFNEYLQKETNVKFDSEEVDNDVFFKCKEVKPDRFQEKKIVRKKLPDVNMSISLDIIKSKLEKKKLATELKQKSFSKVIYKTNLNSAAADIEKELDQQLLPESFEKVCII